MEVTKDVEVTKVIFRKFKEDDVIALFPEQTNTRFTLCYMHIGQHSDCDYNHIVSTTKLATEEEYADLKKELESIGYNLKVIKKVKVKYGMGSNGFLRH